SSVEMGGIKLAEAKVVNRAVVIPGTILEVPSVPIKTAVEKGSAKGIKTSWRADL
ncbi:hypothetical protein Tco_0436862, partial [Tanacetum coccineum]